jgi:tetratricopeptide (TPR) repeat protein
MRRPLSFVRFPISRPIGQAEQSVCTSRIQLTGRILLAGATGWGACPLALAQQAAQTSVPALSATKPAGVENSTMDGQLFYQLLVGEMRGKDEPGYAYQIYLQLGKQYKSAQLFQRSVEIALTARAGEQALGAAKAWRQALPNDIQAAEFTARILMALNRPQAMVEPLRSLIQLTPQPQQPQTLARLTRSLLRLTDRAATARLVDEVTQPWREPNQNFAEAWLTSGEAWMAAGDAQQAYARLKQALSLNPALTTAGLLATDLMVNVPEAEAIVTGQLAASPSDALRLAYARRLLSMQRTADATAQLDQVVKTQPSNAIAWLSLGAARSELNQLDEAEKATKRFIELAVAAQARSTTPASDEVTAESNQALDPAMGYLKMAQLSERRNQLDQADQWLQKADPKGEKMNVQIIRAKLVAAQGKMSEARKLLQAIQETEPRDALFKINAEAQLLREHDQHVEAYAVLKQGRARFPQDPELMYDLGMVSEHLQRHEEAEALLNQLIAVQPDHANAYNALGYSLADRGIRLDEAQALLSKAMQLRPGDPFITDSMGWLLFRQGKAEEALVLLQQAYAARPDNEIGIHLGEVLWVLNRQDEARKVWREVRDRDAGNALLKRALDRLKVTL